VDTLSKPGTRANLEADLFTDLALDRLDLRLTGLHSTARKHPAKIAFRPASTHQKHHVISGNDGNNDLGGHSCVLSAYQRVARRGVDQLQVDVAV
jgi:hypothetical protein